MLDGGVVLVGIVVEEQLGKVQTDERDLRPKADPFAYLEAASVIGARSPWFIEKSSRLPEKPPQRYM